MVRRDLKMLIFLCCVSRGSCRCLRLGWGKHPGCQCSVLLPAISAYKAMVQKHEVLVKQDKSWAAVTTAITAWLSHGIWGFCICTCPTQVQFQNCTALLILHLLFHVPAGPVLPAGHLTELCSSFWENEGLFFCPGFGLWQVYQLLWQSSYFNEQQICWNRCVLHEVGTNWQTILA